MLTSVLVSQAAAAPAAGAGGDPFMSALVQILPFFLILILFWFMIIRPQQKRMKTHREMISNLRRGDTVVTSGGLIGKIRNVQDDEVKLELATGVEVRVVRGTIAEVRNKGEPAPANDTKG
jgi:preprotein translocase subunit YajC